MQRIGSFVTCSLHWLLWGEWRSMCSRAHEMQHICPRWRLFVRLVGKEHCARSAEYHGRSSNHKNQHQARSPMRPVKDVQMTDLERFARAVDLARKASRARIGREITTEEMPDLLAGIFAGERIVAGLFEVSIGKEQTNACTSLSTDTHPD